MEDLKNNSAKYAKEDLEINDTNFLKIVEEKVEYYKKTYLEKAKEEERIESNIDNQIRKLINPPKKLEGEKNKKKKRFEILKKNLIFLRDNKISIEQLQGFLSNQIKDIRSELLDLVSDIEANIDYPEYDIEEVTTERINNVLDNVSNKLFDLENSFSTGKILREGIKTAIIGRPNAGKSSLLNCILKEDRDVLF